MGNLNLPYNDGNLASILNHASLLLDKSLSDILPTDANIVYKGKGGFGQKVEKLHFLYNPNSNAEPDFPKVGLEVKTAPLKKIRKGYVSKERLVFNSINFQTEYKETFATSSFWKKNQLLLLMFYLHENDKIDFDFLFKIIRIWQFPANDLKIIIDDWSTIINKIKSGNAHELSEGDTLYLGACPKGANRESKVSQPFSTEKAMKRAFSLKSKYINYIIEKSFANEEISIDYNEYDRLLNNPNVNEPTPQYRRVNWQDIEPIVKSIDEYASGETFEDLVIKKFRPFYGKSLQEIAQELGMKISSSKNFLNILSKGLLGVSKKKIEEFEKADVLMKTVKVESSGALKESMSFSQIQYEEIIHEDWDESYWYSAMSKRFFFIVFQKDDKQVLRLKKVFFWTMPPQDLNIAEEFWTDTKTKIINNDFEHFYKLSDDKFFHVRPKGRNSFDLMKTAKGTFEKKKSFWLNSSYIKEIIRRNS